MLYEPGNCVFFYLSPPPKLVIFYYVGYVRVSLRFFISSSILVVAVNGEPKPDPKAQMAIVLPGNIERFGLFVQFFSCKEVKKSKTNTHLE